MGITFATRGDDLDAVHIKSLKEPFTISNANATRPASISLVSAGVINSKVFETGDLNGFQHVTYSMLNGGWPFPGFAILTRVYTLYSGSPSFNSGVFSLLGGAGVFKIEMTHLTSGNLLFQAILQDSVIPLNFQVAWSPALNVVYDIFFRWTGVSGQDGEMWVDAVQIGQATASAANNDDGQFQSLILGGGRTSSQSATHINEVVIWDDGAIDPTSILLADDSTAALNGAARSQFVKATQFEGLNSVALAAAKVQTGESYTINGVTDIGELDAFSVRNADYKQIITVPKIKQIITAGS